MRSRRKILQNTDRPVINALTSRDIRKNSISNGKAEQREQRGGGMRRRNAGGLAQELACRNYPRKMSFPHVIAFYLSEILLY